MVVSVFETLSTEPRDLLTEINLTLKVSLQALKPLSHSVPLQNVNNILNVNGDIMLKYMIISMKLMFCGATMFKCVIFIASI